MAEEQLTINEIFAENTDFSDTGSQFLHENQDILEETDPKNSNFNETAEKSGESPVNSDKNLENTNVSKGFTGGIDAFFTEENENSLKLTHPNINIKDLRNNKDFCALLNTITQNPTLSQVYSCFNSIIASAEHKSRQKALQTMANAKSSVGSLASSKENSTPFFTKEQVLQMSPEQIRKNYTEIRKSQQSW